MSAQFYDELTPLYHLIYADWDASIERQADQLESVIQEFWGDRPKTVLDAACGIGTQALGLARRGFTVTASDLSPGAVERAKQEALKRDLTIDFSVADMAQAFDHHRRAFDVVIACDNSIPHLLSDADILRALKQFYRCTEPGGGCIISVRDYATMNLQGVQVHPYGIRREHDGRYFIFQVWEFEGSIYDLSMYFVKDDGGSSCTTSVLRSKYYAITVERLTSLMAEAGFEDVQRLDGRFFQPIVLGTRRTRRTRRTRSKSA
jgi:SAM-dependent methyltransferase